MLYVYIPGVSYIQVTKNKHNKIEVPISYENKSY